VFPAACFAPRYFAPRYFPKVGGAVVVGAAPVRLALAGRRDTTLPVAGRRDTTLEIVGFRQMALRRSLSFFRGEDVELDLSLAEDLTGLALDFSVYDSSGARVVNVTTLDGGIVVAPGVGGLASGTLPRDVTLALAAGVYTHATSCTTDGSHCLYSYGGLKVQDPPSA
jgi:hypothetical protein